MAVERGNELLPGGKGIRRWWYKKIGRTEDGMCPKCGEEEQTSDHAAVDAMLKVGSQVIL